MTAQQSTRFLTPYSKHARRDFNSACGVASPPALSPRLHGTRGKKDHASSSMQTGIHTSPGLFATALAGVRGEETPQRSFLTQFLIDVLAVLVAFTLIIATGLGLGFAVFALMFFSF